MRESAPGGARGRRSERRIGRRWPRWAVHGRAGDPGVGGVFRGGFGGLERRIWDAGEEEKTMQCDAGARRERGERQKKKGLIGTKGGGRDG